MLPTINDDSGSGYGRRIGDKTNGQGDIFRRAGAAKGRVFVGNPEILFRLFA